MDARLLDDALSVAESISYLNALLIVRNGKLVLEEYFYGFKRNDAHLVRSVSKSFTSALVGIALEKGLIEGVNQHVLDFFPEMDLPGLDYRKRNLTVKHLLTMRAGVEDDHAVYMTIHSSGNWIESTFLLPQLAAPGSGFSYNTFLTHLLSVMITRTSGQSTLDFAVEHLFQPLDISAEKWERDPQSYYFGGSGMYFRPRDMARLGYLYLNNGSIDGEQIVRQAWVEASLCKYSEFSTAWGALEEIGYGYCWWLGKLGDYEIFTALGHGGQYILCIPDLQMIIVTCCDSNVDWDPADAQERRILDLMKNEILTALQ